MKRKQAAEKTPVLKMGKRIKDEKHRSIQLVDMQYCFANFMWHNSFICLFKLQGKIYMFFFWLYLLQTHHKM